MGGHMEIRSINARRLLESACNLFELGDHKKAIKVFLKAAALGSVEAQINIANVYNEGDGIKSDFDQARYWYKRAISLGSPEAAYNLGTSYLNRGNARWAKYWLTFARSLGDEDADEQLSRL